MKDESFTTGAMAKLDNVLAARRLSSAILDPLAQ